MLDVWAMAFGCMVGWGTFVMPGTTFLPVAGPAGTVISMTIGMAFQPPPLFLLIGFPDKLLKRLVQALWLDRLGEMRVHANLQ